VPGVRLDDRAGPVKAPQRCPPKGCGRSLADPNLPAEYQGYSNLFSLVMETPTEWACPFCGHRWPKLTLDIRS
jgi:hypothetical protein